MIGLAVQTIRARWVSLVGTVVALVLGVALIAAMMLLLLGSLHVPDRPAERFSQAQSVVLPTDPTWDPAKHDLGVRSLPEARGVSPDLFRKVAATGEAVPDREFYAQIVGGPKAQVGHPWAVARFGGYALRSGTVPSSDTDVVVAADHARVGEWVTVLTAADGVGRYRVSGIVAPVGWEDAIFFTDPEAARLSPRIGALVALGPTGRVRAAVGNDAEVLTGQDRHKADPSSGEDREALDNTVTLVPVMASVAGVAAIFVVASTFAFAVVQRRREFALLRLVGATGAQVRRMVRGEALLVGVFGSALGCALGLPAARWLVDMFIGMGISPPWLTVEPSLQWTVLAPLAGVFVLGVVVSVCGAVAASRRAGNAQPMDALRDAAVDDTGMRPGRWLVGAVALLGGIGWTAWIAVASPESMLSPNTYVVSLTVPVVAAAVLAPLAVGPVTKLVMRPFRRCLGPVAMLVRESALAARARTAATAAPILLTIGLTVSLICATDSLSAARDNVVQNQVTAEYALTPDNAPGISPHVIDRIAGINGVRIAAPLLTTIYTDDGGRTEQNDGLVVDPTALKQTMNLKVVGGSLNAFNAGSVVVADLWGKEVGSTLTIDMADGHQVNLRVAATYHAIRGEDVAYLPPRFAPTAAYARDGLARRAYISLDPGVDRAATTRAIRQAVIGTGASFVTKDQLAASDSAYARHLTDVRQRSTAIIIVLFCFIAILNTMLMATAHRKRDLATLRLVGATPKQAVRFFLAEALLVTTVGLVLALAATAVNLAGLWAGLRQLFDTTPITLPYGIGIGVTVASALIAIVGALVPVVAALRSRAELPVSARE